MFKIDTCAKYEYVPKICVLAYLHFGNLYFGKFAFGKFAFWQDPHLDKTRVCRDPNFKPTISAWYFAHNF